MGRTKSVSDFHKIFINAFIITTLNSLGELPLTSFSLLLKKIQTQIIWNSMILKTIRDGETAIF